MQNNQVTTPQFCTSGRKLPAVPNKIPSQNSKKNSLKQQILLQEYSILQEYHLVARTKIASLYVIPSTKSSLKWYGVFFVKTGHYKGGVFQFTLVLPDSFPSDQTPLIVFDLPVYHPSVHPVTNQYNIGPSFKPWNASLHRVWHLLNELKKSFIIIETEEPVNTQAAIDYKLNIIAFKQKVEASITHFQKFSEKFELTEEKENNAANELTDNHQLCFKQLDEEVYEKLRRQLLCDNKDKSKNIEKY